jgi:hypothetical protein
VAICVVIAGCSGEPGSIAESESQGGLPAEAITAKASALAQDPIYPFPRAGWLDSGRKFAVVLSGSSSCPAFPSSVEAMDPHRIKLGIDTRGGPNCTADLAPRTYVISTPAGVDVAQEVTLEYGESTVTLPGL